MLINKKGVVIKEQYQIIDSLNRDYLYCYTYKKVSRFELIDNAIIIKSIRINDELNPNTAYLFKDGRFEPQNIFKSSIKLNLSESEKRDLTSAYGSILLSDSLEAKLIAINDGLALYEYQTKVQESKYSEEYIYLYYILDKKENIIYKSSFLKVDRKE